MSQLAGGASKRARRRKKDVHSGAGNRVAWRGFRAQDVIDRYEHHGTPAQIKRELFGFAESLKAPTTTTVRRSAPRGSRPIRILERLSSDEFDTHDAVVYPASFVL